MSPTSQGNLSSPISSDAADCWTSDSDSSGAGSYRSRAPTPQCLPLDDIIPENDAISQEAMCHYMDLARSHFVNAQGRAATPCSSLDADPNTDLEMMMLGDFVQSQSSNVLDSFDWGKASTMALEELPDSDLCYQPGYQLTQEWLEQTVKHLKELDEEKLLAAEREVDKRAEIGADMDVDGLSHGGNEASYDS